MARKRRRLTRRRSYAAKRAARGGDSYGTWREGRRINPERIAGRVIY